MLTLIIAAVLAFVVLGCAAFYFGQERMIYYPRPYTKSEVANLAPEVIELRYGTSQGEQVAFYRGKAGSEPRKVWLCFGGNGARALDWLEFVRALPREAEDGFLLVDYPGYGSSEGKPSPESIEESIGGAVDALTTQLGMTEAELKPRLAVLGHSIGAAAALIAADRHGAQTVVLISPFTSMQDLAVLVAGRPLSSLVRHRYDNRARLASVLEESDRVRVTILHGEEDEVIPFRMGEELAGTAPDRIEFHAIPGAHHNDIFGIALPVVSEAMR